MKRNVVIGFLILFIIALMVRTPSATSCYNDLQEAERSGYAYRLAAERMDDAMKGSSVVIGDYIRIMNAALSFNESPKGENPLRKRIDYLMGVADKNTHELSDSFADARVFLKIAKDKEPLPNLRK